MCKTDKIDMNKTYRTAAGMEVTLLAKYLSCNETYFVGLVNMINYDQFSLVWNKYGETAHGDAYRLVEYNPATELKLDQPIWVSNHRKVWLPRHFAKYENGRVYAWLSGVTSHTSLGNEAVEGFVFWKTENPNISK